MSARDTALAIIERARRDGRVTLAEHESKELVAAYGIPVNQGRLVEDEAGLEAACQAVGWPVALKASAADLAHKTEAGVVRLGLADMAAARQAWREIRQAAPRAPVLAQEMVSGQRELVMGLVRDAQMGPAVMFGLGGIFTEALKDFAFRLAPLEARDAREMLGEIRGKAILGALRGLPPADAEALAAMLVGLGRLGAELGDVAEVDLNPVILAGARPVAVDALVVLTPRA